jgi:DNA-binding CsgD family transcriptional regulator
MARSHYRRTRNELTERQRQVLSLLASGKTNREIGDALGMTLDGAKFHVSELMAKLGVATREEAAEWWRSQKALATRLRGFVSLAGFKWAGAATGAVAVAVGAVIVLRSLGGSANSNDAQGGAEGYVAAIRGPDGLELVGSGWSRTHLPSEAASDHELIVLGRLEEVSSGKPSVQPEPFIAVYRVGTFVIDEVIKGPDGFSDGQVPVYMPGGEYGGISMGVYDIGPEIVTGDRAILFLRQPQGRLGEPGTWVSHVDVRIYSEQPADRTGDLIPLEEALAAISTAAR